MNQRNSGFSLIEVLVAIGLMGILALGIAEIFRQQIFVQDKVRDRGSLEDMRNVVRSVVNCQLPCVANMVRIPTNQGRWVLSPVCEGPGLKVLVTDSKGKSPPKTGNLFTINDGYICMYLDESNPVPQGSQMPAPSGLPLSTNAAMPGIADQKELEKVLEDALEEVKKNLPAEAAGP